MSATKGWTTHPPESAHEGPAALAAGPSWLSVASDNVHFSDVKPSVLQAVREGTMTHSIAALEAGASHRVLATADDVERVARYVEASLSESTRRAYATDWRQWEAWTRGRGLDALPADPASVAAYLTTCADNGASPSSVARAAAAITHRHRSSGHQTPCSHEGVRRVLRGVRRSAVQRGYTARKARALDTTTVRAVVEDLPDTPAGARDRALLLTAFALGLRASDAVWLDVTDIAAAARGDGLDVTVRHSKTDQEGAGVVLALARGARTSTCPVIALGNWIRRADLLDGPLFRPVTKGGAIGTSRLTTRSVTRILHRAAEQAGVSLSHLSSHSLRRGYATQAYAGGVPEREIARTGRWASVTVMRGYNDSGRWADPASSRLGL